MVNSISLILDVLGVEFVLFGCLPDIIGAGGVWWGKCNIKKIISVKPHKFYIWEVGPKDGDENTARFTLNFNLHYQCDIYDQEETCTQK